MCLYPKLIKNRKYIANKTNGGNIPTIQDERTRYVAIGCQLCIECKKQKAREWQVRLLEDIKTNKNGKFITLTFSDEWIDNLLHGYTTPKNEYIKGITEIEETKNATGYQLDNAIATRAVRLFLERYRKEHKTSIRHWLVTELGHTGTENIHLHGIIWTDENLNKIEKIWQYGFVWKGKKRYNTLLKKWEIQNYVNEQTINYIVKYVNKIDELHPLYQSKILTSPGIGKTYTEQKLGDWKKNRFDHTNTIETYKTRQGYKITLPIYWRNKIYTEEQRETLWLQKLDKQERWVLGQKIDVSKNDKEYIEALKEAQAFNKRLKYGDGNKTWEQAQYERDRRTLMQQTRIKNAQKAQD